MQGDSAGGVQFKGADEVIVHNCVVERSNLTGIGVGFDPYWCLPLVPLCSPSALSLLALAAYLSQWLAEHRAGFLQFLLSDSAAQL